MANGTSAAGGLLEGLVGGALLGSDFRRQRTFDRQDAEDRRRRRRLEDERLRMFREDRNRSQAIEDLQLRDERGLAFGRPDPTPVEQLRTGTGRALMTFEDLQAPEAREDVLQARAIGRGTPEGFYRVAPDPMAAEMERVRGLREGVGRFLAAGAPQDMLGEPNVIEGLASYDLLDDIMERYGATGTPRDPVNWQVQETEDGLVQVNPETGQVRPLSAPGGGSPLRRPEDAAKPPPRPTEGQMRLQQVLPRAESALQTIERLVESFDGTVPAATLGRRFGIGGRYATPEQEQLYNQAAESLATSILRAESGAAITEDERESYREQFIPEPGDKPTTVQQKLQALRETLEAMRSISTLGGSDSPPSEFSPDNPYAPGG